MTTEPEAIPADVMEAAEKIATDHCTVIDYERELAEDIAHAILADRASRAPVDGAGWRPIETAPKDGTNILLHGRVHRPSIDAGNVSTVIAYWADMNGGGWVWYGALSTVFTHWMPLPTAPGTHPSPASPDADWKRAFAAQSRKLQAVLHLPGVKEALAELTWTDGEPVEASSSDAEMVRVLRSLAEIAEIARRTTTDLGIQTQLGVDIEAARRLLSKHGGDW